MRRPWLCLAALLCGCAAMPTPRRLVEPSALVLHVAPEGRDEWSGRLAAANPQGTDGPVATLERARHHVRRALRAGLATPVRVVVHQGIYELADTLRFGPHDGGTAECPITYQAEPGARVVLRGGRAVRGWRPWRRGILQADLNTQGMAGATFYQLFYRGRRQPLARHPNRDPHHPRTGGFAYIEARGPRPPEQFFYEHGSIPFEAWHDLSQAEVVTVFGRGWNFAIAPIAKADTEHRLVTVARRVRRPFEPDNRFYVRNVLDALDAPGEWYLDRKASVLYFRPPHGRPGDGDVVVPLLDHLVELKGSVPYPHGYLKVGYGGTKADFPVPDDAPPPAPVEHITLHGFRLECARQDAVRLVGARRCAVVGCTIANVGNVGINMGGVACGHPEVGNPRAVEATGFFAGVGGGGQNLLFNDPCQECRALGNDVHHVGSDGIFLYGAANHAENNHVHDIGLFDKDCACINAFGEGNVVRRNTLHDVPRNAVFLKGTDNLVELNDIHHTLLETCDGGAIRMCQRNLALRGNVVRFNRILDTVGYGYPAGRDYQSPYYSWGIYLDDFTCGTTVHGNIVARTGRGGIHVHGGSDNHVTNNIVVDAGSYQFENNPIRQRPAAGNVVARNVFAYDGTDAHLYSCGKWLEGSVAWERNVVWCRRGPLRVRLGRGTEIEGWEAWHARGLERDSVVADPRFRQPAADDYRLRRRSPAWRLGFQRIPVEEIGCYPSPQRAAWPLRVEPRPVREKPVLRRAPVRPLRESFEWDTPGQPPRRGDVSAPSPSAIRVTDKLAASGTRCLQIVDAPGLPRPWQPRIYYGMDYREGTVRFACDLRLDSAAPPLLAIDFRQYSEAAGQEYLSGPMLVVGPDGQLAAGGKPLLKLPLDTWCHLEVTIALGPAASGRHELTVRPGRVAPSRFRLPHRAPAFRRLQRIVLISNSTSRAVCYVDNVSCSPLPPH